MQLRDYQQKAIDSIYANLPESNKLLLSLGTGLGKTVIFTNLAKSLIRNRKKVLVLAHREELLSQVYETFQKIDRSLLCVIDQGEKRVGIQLYEQADILIASVATLGRKKTERLNIYNPEDFVAVIIDECHHSLSESYVRVLEYFGISKHPPLKEIKEKYPELDFQNKEIREKTLDWNKNCLLLGVTATPMRTKSGETLKHIFDKLVFKYDLISAIKDGWLCNIHNLSAETKIDISKVRITNGDFNSKDLAQKVNTDARNQFIVDTYLKEAQKGATLVFTVDKNHNEALKKRFNDSGIDAEVVDSDTPKDQRKDILDRFKNQDLPVLINCGIFTEGTDIPNVMNILMAKPTKSLILYTQILGRGTRLHEGKDKCVVIDFVDNNSKHNVMTLKHLMGIPDGKDIAKKQTKDIKKELELIEEVGADILGQLALTEEEVGDVREFKIIDKGLILDVISYVRQNFVKESKFTWFKIFEDTWFLPLPNYQTINTKKGVIKFARSRLKLIKGWDEYELWFEGNLMDKKRVETKIGVYEDVKMFDARIDAILLENNIEAMFLKKGQRWHRDLCTTNQKNFIMKLLANYSGRRQIQLLDMDLNNLTKGDAGCLINVLRYEIKI